MGWEMKNFEEPYGRQCRREARRKPRSGLLFLNFSSNSYPLPSIHESTQIWQLNKILPSALETISSSSSSSSSLKMKSSGFTIHAVKFLGSQFLGVYFLSPNFSYKETYLEEKKKKNVFFRWGRPRWRDAWKCVQNPSFNSRVNCPLKESKKIKS